MRASAAGVLGLDVPPLGRPLATLAPPTAADALLAEMTGEADSQGGTKVHVSRTGSIDVVVRPVSSSAEAEAVAVDGVVVVRRLAPGASASSGSRFQYVIVPGFQHTTATSPLRRKIAS